MPAPSREPYLIDSHCHLHDPEFFTPEQQLDFLEDARQQNVRQIICIGTSPADSLRARAFAESHENVFWSYGIHPEEAVKKEDFKSLFEVLKSSSLVAIGEIGLDYHYPSFDKQSQWRLLEQMLSLAIDLSLPCSFHVRDALPDFFAIVHNFPSLKPSVLHSFTDSKTNLNRALDQGFYLGLNGIATFANLDCYRTLTPELLDRLVLETDAPFLTPAPKRGKINKPGNIAHIASWLSEKLGVSVSQVAEKTSNNVRKVFNLPNPEAISCPGSS
ncbi:TatD family hydrolase [Candidatus Saccharibacteria bacterium]|nr:TatD family hydrolase [Candidatus Saccharibacteria bacterium]